MNKKDRQLIFEKYKGHCAYCGCILFKGWHVDEIEPCIRKWKWMEGYWTGNNNSVWIKRKKIFDGYENPEALHIDNQNPACPSCNINKHSMPLEEFRAAIKGFMKHLNEINTQYKIAKRYGLVVEIDKPVIFYFEQINQSLIK